MTKSTLEICLGLLSNITVKPSDQNAKQVIDAVQAAMTEITKELNLYNISGPQRTIVET